LYDAPVPKKKSAKHAAQQFVGTAAALNAYAASVDGSPMSAQEKSWAYEAALIKLAVGFERLMLEALVCATNNDTDQMSKTLKVDFPKHLTDEVCEYIVTGGGYFDFKGRDGLLGAIKGLVGSGHYLYVAVKKPKYKVPLEQLIALRNFAAHESSKSKQVAREALNRTNLSSAGSYLKVQGRFGSLNSDLNALAMEIQAAAPY
jgi:cupin superfamily acireductone dioxygenase involved in methionine salvage